MSVRKSFKYADLLQKKNKKLLIITNVENQGLGDMAKIKSFFQIVWPTLKLYDFNLKM